MIQSLKLRRQIGRASQRLDLAERRASMAPWSPGSPSEASSVLELRRFARSCWHPARPVPSATTRLPSASGSSSL